MKIRLLLAAALLFIAANLHAQLIVNQGVSQATLLSSLLGQGLSVSNVTLNCPTNAYGTFSNGNTTNLGLTNGILLTSGSANNAIGPNTIGSTGTCNGTSSADPQLTAIEPLANEDLCVLEFDVVVQCNQLTVTFVFGSEEYPEFVNGGFNDAFGFFISGPGPSCQANFYNNTNVATLPNGTPVSIDNVNNGTTNTGPCVNCANYVNNTGGTSIQYDAFTTVITRNVQVCPCQTYHFKIAIADAGDCQYDSGVFVDFMACSSALSGTTSSVGTCTCTGSASVNAAGGQPPYTYSWAPSGGTGATANNLCPGTYTVTVNDALSCNSSQTFAVTVPNSSTLASSSSTTASVCNANNGTATANPSGGTPGYTYSWAPGGQTSQTATGLAPGTYTCTITDATGCTTTTTATVGASSGTLSSTTGSTTNVTCFGGSNGSATASPSGGTPGYSYSWAPSGGTGQTASGLTAGTYTCTITDASGCVTTTQATITQPSALSTTSNSTPSVCNANNGTATASPSGGTGPYTYSWSPGGGTSATITGLAPGNYSVTVTDANGCTTSSTVSVTSSSGTLSSTTSSTSNVSCFGGSNGSATASPSGGTPGYTYSWAPSGGTNATENNLPAGTYTCTITDATGCTTTTQATITQPAALSTASNSTPATCTASDGTATTTPAGGTGPYTYSWTPGGQTASTATGLAAGSYTVTITDGNGCTLTDSTTVSTSPGTLTASSSGITDVSCFGGSNGSATASPSGGTPSYAYSWTPSGGTNATASTLAAGTYTCTITDASGCVTTITATITQPTAISSSITSTDPTCGGGNNGTAGVTVSGGTPGYTYNWSPSGGTGANASNLGPGSYTCTITDANGCTQTQSVTLSQAPGISVTASQTNLQCNGVSTGSATVSAGGGTPPFTYSWSPSGGTGATASGLAAGSYTCTITDAAGCTQTQTFSITQPAALTISSTGDNACQGQGGTISAAAGGGTPGYTYSWSNSLPNGASQNVNPTQTTTYTVTVTDANGCSNNTTVVYTVNPNPVAAFSMPGTNGVLNLSISTGGPQQVCLTNGSTGATVYGWTMDGGSPSTQQNPCFTVSDTGYYCFELIAATTQGCIDTTEQCLRVTESFYNIPNVFTPGSDGHNDAFIITNSGMKSLHCMLFNRWGQVVYEWNDVNGKWDGKTNGGDLASDGVYYYVATMVNFGDEEFVETGFVQLIRGK